MPTWCGPRGRLGADPGPEPSIGGDTDPDRPLMTRIFRSVGFVLALATAASAAARWPGRSAGLRPRRSDGFTPLPPGWELCVLEGVAAPATAANVADLDEWQAAEGGSTNNTAAYNPFNTQRTTDATDAPIPGVVSANGFPAFPTWVAGCSATVATLFQPNMWVITAALRAGNVTPQPPSSPSSTRAVVRALADGRALLRQCHRGHPGQHGPGCARLVRARRLREREQRTCSPTSSLSPRWRPIRTWWAIRDLALAAAESQVTSAQGQLGAASRALQSFAVNEYISSGLYSGAPLVSNAESQPLSPSTPQDTDGVVAQQYLGVTANSLVTHDDAAAGAFKDVRATPRRRREGSGTGRRCADVGRGRPRTGT